MFMISVLSVCCCALLNFESFIYGHFLSFLIFFFKDLICSSFCCCCCCCFLWFFGGVFFFFFFGGGGVLVPLNGIKKYLA